MTAISTVASPRAASLALAALIGGALAMAISPVFVRWAEVGPFTSAFWRVFLALPLLYGWMRASEAGTSQAARPGFRFSRAIVISGLAFTGDLLLWHLAVLNTSVANATFFATMSPVWVIGFGWLLFRHRVGANVLAGLALCLCGGAALLARSLEVHPASAMGDAYGLATGVFFGLYLMAVQAARRDTGAARVTFEISLITAAALFVVAVVFERRLLPETLVGAAALLSVSWISHAGGQGLISVALGRLPVAFSSLVIFLETIAAAGFAFLLLGEPVSLAQALGGVAILAGLYVARPR